MALINHPGMYSEFTERVSNPYSQFATQLLLKKQAQNDAIDEYFKRMNDSINPEGMRDKDIPEFQNKLTALKTYTIQNKDKIRKGDLQAQLERDKLFREAQRHAQLSKDANAANKDFIGVAEKFRTEDMDTEPLFQEFQYNDLPVSDENFRRFDPKPFLATPKPYDRNVHLAPYIKNTPRTETTELGKVDPQTGMRVDATISRISPEALDGLAIDFAKDYHTKQSFNNEVRSIIQNPEQRKQLEDFFVKTFKEPVNSTEDLAAAYGIMSMQPELRKETKPVQDAMFIEDLRQKGRKEMEGIRQANKKAYFNYRMEGGDKERVNILNKYIDDVFEKAKNQPFNVWNEVTGGYEKSRRFYVPKEITDKYTKAKGYSNEDVPVFYITEDKQYIIPNYKGNRKSVGDPIPIENFKGELSRLWLTRTATGEEIVDEMDIDEGSAPPPQQTKPASKPSGKTYKVNGYDYSEQEISDAAKQLGMTKEAYIKKYNIK